MNVSEYEGVYMTEYVTFETINTIEEPVMGSRLPEVLCNV